MGLTGKQLRFLRARGHGLRPTVLIGKGGVGEAVLRQIEAELLARELVKVKLLPACPEDKEACAAAITGATGAVLAQRVGRTLLMYRPHPEEPVLRLPGEEG